MQLLPIESKEDAEVLSDFPGCRLVHSPHAISGTLGTSLTFVDELASARVFSSPPLMWLAHKGRDITSVTLNHVYLMNSALNTLTMDWGN
jgi:hypothetical protein